MSKAVLNRRMTAVDAAFWYAEQKTAPMHIGGLDIVSGRVTAEGMARNLSGKLHLLPRYRQRLVPAPLNLGHPTWEDDPEFDIHNHVVGVELPKPGTNAQLRRMVSRLFGGMLDRDKPLWKVYVIEGLSDGNTAVLTLVHHCMVDGVSGVALWGVMMDPRPEPRAVEPPAEAHAPKGLPAASTLLADALWDNAIAQIDHWSNFQKNALGMARSWRAGQVLDIAKDLPGLARDFLKPVKPLPFNTREFSGKRKLSWSRCSFAEARGIKAACGGTINDVALAALGGAVRDYCGLHGIPVRRRNVRVMVPVSIRREEERMALGNRVSMLPVDIPLWIEDPIDRLEAVTERTSVLKKARVAESLDLVFQFWQGAHPAAQRTAGAMVFAPSLQKALGRIISTPGMHMVCTNVPGPQIPLYCLGREVLDHYPLLPVAPGMGLNVGVFSYNQRIAFGLIADSYAAPDVAKFNRFLDDSFQELREAAGVPVVPFVDLKKSSLAMDVKAAREQTIQIRLDANGVSANGVSANGHVTSGGRKKATA